MALENKSGIITENLDPWDSDIWGINSDGSSFEFMVDTACERLWGKQVECSIRRIKAMQEKLDTLEKELEELIKRQVNP